MCGRYGLKLGIDEIVAAALEIGELDAEALAVGTAVRAWLPSTDIAPTDQAPVVLARRQKRPRQLALASWGIGRPAAGKRPTLVINARAETVTARPLFRDGTPALVPASGWYEWPADQPLPGRPRPTWLSQDTSASNTPTWLAGLSFDDGDFTRFVILTRPPMPDIEAVHDRMPAIVPRALIEGWLAGRVAATQLMNAPLNGLHYVSVDPRPTGRRSAPSPPAQLDLFGDPKRG